MDVLACSLKATIVSSCNKGDLVKVTSGYKNMTKPWVSWKGREGDVLQTIRTSLLQLKDAMILKELKVTGFLPAADSDYEEARKAMRLSMSFRG